MSDLAVRVRALAAFAIAGRGRGLVAALAGVLAWRWAGTPGGGAAWVVAAPLAASGYGELFARAAGRRLSLVQRIVVGVAATIVVATALAQVGLAHPSVLLGLLAVGAVACALPDPPGEPAAPAGLGLPSIAVAAAFAIAAILVGIELVHPATVFDEEVDHVFAVKQLFDTGALPPLAHQLGGQLVGEALFGLVPGAHVVAVFDGGVALVLLLLALAELVPSDRSGPFLYALLALPIALNPEPRGAEIPHWAIALFALAAWTAIARALDRERIAWDAIPCACALALGRHELVGVAAVLVAAAVVLPTRRLDRRALAIGAVALVAVVAGVGVALGATLAPARAVGVVAATVAATAASAILVIPRGADPRPLALALVTGFVALFGSVIGAIPTVARGLGTGGSIWFVVAAVVVIHVDEAVATRRAAARVRAPAMLVAVALIAVYTIGPNFTDTRRWHLRDRFTDACADLAEVLSRGYRLDVDGAARALQERVPPGTPIGFWGQGAARLDFARNPIRDLSFARRRRRTIRGTFLVPLDDERLADRAYVLVEEIPQPPEPTDAFDDPRTAFELGARARVTEVARVGSVALYKVGPAP